MTRELDYDTIGFIMSLEHTPGTLGWAKRHLLHPNDADLIKLIDQRIAERGDVPLPGALGIQTTESRALALPYTNMSTSRALAEANPRALSVALEHAFVEPTVDWQHGVLVEYWGQIFQTLGKNIEVPPPKFTLESLRRAQREGFFWFYLPPELSSAESLPELAQALPFARGPYTWDKGSYEYLGGQLQDYDPSNRIAGWRVIHWNTIPQYLGITHREAHEIFSPGEGKIPTGIMSLNLYIAASGLHFVLTGKFFDETHFSRLFGTLIDRQAIVVNSRAKTGNIVVRKAEAFGYGKHESVGVRAAGERYFAEDINMDEIKAPLPEVPEYVDFDMATKRAIGRAISNVVGKIVPGIKTK